MIIYTNPNAPSCIREIFTHPSDAIQKSIKELTGPGRVVLGTICPCGSEVFTIEVEDGIVYIVCVLCGFRFIIFDPRRHGLRALCNPKLHEDSDIAFEYSCAKCGNSGARINVALLYPPNEELPELSEKLRAKSEDLFIGYSLAVHCSKCGNLELIYDADCSCPQLK